MSIILSETSIAKLQILRDFQKFDESFAQIKKTQENKQNFLLELEAES